MVTVDRHDAITLKIANVISQSKKLDIEIYFFIPGELGITPNIISESNFYYNSITQKRVYYSDKILLPLVHSRLAKRGKLSFNQYRVSLSLFAYQYVTALDKAVNQFNKKNNSETIIDDILNMIELSLDILKRLRRSVPEEKDLKHYYNNIDNYLSWYTEQRFLSLISHMNRDADYKAIKEELIAIIEKEQLYREEKNYNSTRVQADITRLSNKMRLLRRLIEHPIKLNEQLTSLGSNMKRMVKGLATGLVMIVVTIVAISARGYWGEITASFIMAMSFVYALREIFKDDLRDILWRWIRKNRPKWRRRYSDPNTKKVIGQKLEWLDYLSSKLIPKDILAIRKKKIAQREEKILRYRSEVQMSSSQFLSGYEETKESLMVDLRSIARLINKGSNKIYQLNNGQVSRESVEKRHLINLVIKEDNHLGEPNYYRWKVVLNRSKIIDIEAIEQVDNKESKNKEMKEKTTQKPAGTDTK
ncbi:hypothetical protein L0B53_17605 [Vibrio sp. SS-MA-C1-2]|uniref:hypothetical protein n=1 Tax=Vibrio sp. SS-MA-C1-2 TaxID=2908646 RepID=UPI001F3417F1|nr:hypothetical protein [Vibrio sp. SS-MA-C1-2]UJF18781.1 hypothetical protein L0B53_17605 [Vibrio sp. SS-MA-C1-2]